MARYAARKAQDKMLAKRKRVKRSQEYPSAHVPASISRHRINLSGQSFP